MSIAVAAQSSGVELVAAVVVEPVLLLMPETGRTTTPNNSTMQDR